MMTELNWIPLDSSTVAEAAFDSETESIYARFVNGGAYRYDECPPHVWTEFTAPETSPGKYVHTDLKFKPTTKLED
jgi:hypothetical protein